LNPFKTSQFVLKNGDRIDGNYLLLALRKLETEVEKTLKKETARAEAERCLNCGRPAEVNKTCWYCLPCEIECPVQALEVRMPYLVR